MQPEKVHVVATVTCMRDEVFLQIREREKIMADQRNRDRAISKRLRSIRFLDVVRIIAVGTQNRRLHHRRAEGQCSRIGSLPGSLERSQDCRFMDERVQPRATEIAVVVGVGQERGALRFCAFCVGGRPSATGKTLGSADARRAADVATAISCSSEET